MLFEESDFRWIFDRRKVGQKFENWRLGAAKGESPGNFGEGSAGRAAAVGGFWSLTGTDKNLT